MRCYRSSNKCYQHHGPKQPLCECCQFHLIQIIHYLTELFEQEKIYYWAHFGTLLAAVRDNGKIIPWDNDGDLGVFTDNKKRILGLRSRIEGDGYGFNVNHNSLIQIGYTDINWIYCDIWLYDMATAREHVVGKDNNFGIDLFDPIETEVIDSDEPILKCMAPWMQINHTCDIPYWFIERTDQQLFEGKLINCPRHAKKFLYFLYGDDWETPKEKDTTGYCGNFYSLSKWLKYVENQKKINKSEYCSRRQQIEQPLCRWDTPACDTERECCILHKKEMMCLITDYLLYYHVNYTTKFKNYTLFIDSKDYEGVVQLAGKIGKYYNFSFQENKILMYFGPTNKNYITVKIKN